MYTTKDFILQQIPLSKKYNVYILCNGINAGIAYGITQKQYTAMLKAHPKPFNFVVVQKVQYALNPTMHKGQTVAWYYNVYHNGTLILVNLTQPILYTLYCKTFVNQNNGGYMHGSIGFKAIGLSVYTG